MAAATMAPVGEPIVWQDGNASGAVRTVRIGQSASGLQCREFHHTVTIGGRTQQAYGTSCLQPDGSWGASATTSRPNKVRHTVLTATAALMAWRAWGERRPAHDTAR